MKTERHKIGSIAEAKVLAYLIENDYQVYLPFIDNGPVDMIATKDNNILRVSVKGTTKMGSKKSWRVSICTTSRIKNGINTNRFQKDACDIIAVYIGPIDKVVLIKSSLINAEREIAVDPEDISRIL